MTYLPPLEDRTLYRAFQRALAEKPDDIAQVDTSGGSWTVQEAYDRSLRLAGGLIGHGASRGKAVAALLDNHFDAVHTYLGMGLIGIIQVPINTAYKGSFLSHVLNDSGADTLVIEDAYCDRLAAVAGDLPLLKRVIVRGGSGEALRDHPFEVSSFDDLLTATAAESVACDPWEVQGYFYTSGTTGPSKGVRVTYGQAYTYATREDDPRSRPTDRTLVILPLFHLAGQMYGVYQSLIARCLCVLEPVFSLSTFWDVVKQHQINNTVVVGAVAELLYQQPAAVGDADNPLELVYMAPLVSDPTGFADRFGVEVGAVFGGTEFGSPLAARPETVVGGECGYPREGFECRVVDEHDRPLPPGQVGELVIRAELPWTLSDGYLGLPEATVSAWRNQWLHTGDGFKTDETGRFFFVDRMKDSIRRRGENVSSFEVETEVNSFPAVLECAAITVPSELTEDDIKVVVVPRPGETVDSRELIEFLIERMPYFMVPRYVEVQDGLPKTPTQKIQKNELRRAGVTGSTWDREAASVRVDRHS